MSVIAWLIRPAGHCRLAAVGDAYGERKIQTAPDYTALSNWMAHNEVRDNEITSLVLRLADHGMRVAQIENLMKTALREQLEIIEMFPSDEDET